MELTTTETTNIKKRGTSLAETVERLRVTLGWDEKSWADLLDISLQEYREICARQKDFSILTLTRLAGHFDLTLESLISGQLDYRIVATRWAGDMNELPERYSVGAASLRRSSFNLLNGTEELFGWQARTLAMRHLQVTEAAFTNLDEKINLRFNTDLCDYLHRNYGGTHQFYDMGAFAVVTTHNSPLGRLMAQQRDIKTLYEYFVNVVLTNYWERNYTYRISQISPTTCRIESRPNDDVAQALGVRYPGSSFVCQTKVGVAASVPGFLGLPFAHAREVTCVFRGDPCCTIELDFELAARRIQKNRQAVPDSELSC